MKKLFTILIVVSVLCTVDVVQAQVVVYPQVYSCYGGGMYRNTSASAVVQSSGQVMYLVSRNRVIYDSRYVIRLNRRNRYNMNVGPMYYPNIRYRNGRPYVRNVQNYKVMRNRNGFRHR